jgi:hypothetical protein
LPHRRAVAHDCLVERHAGVLCLGLVSIGSSLKWMPIATDYVRAAAAPDAPPALYPVRRGSTAAMRDTDAAARDVHRMQAWASQAAASAQAGPAGELVLRLWQEAGTLAAGRLN